MQVCAPRIEETNQLRVALMAAHHRRSQPTVAMTRLSVHVLLINMQLARIPRSPHIFTQHPLPIMSCINGDYGD